MPTSLPEVTMTVTTDPLLADEATATIDYLMRIVALIRAEKHRDPLRALEDRLLDLRVAVRCD